MRSVVERARTEDALKSSEELYGAVFNWALDGIAMLTLDLEIVDINPALEKMSGYRREDVVGRKVMDLWPGNEVLSNFFADVVRHGSACAEGPVARRDGQIGVREFRGTLVQFGGRTHILEIVRDISERQRAEEERAALESQLRHAQRMEVIGALFIKGRGHEHDALLLAVAVQLRKGLQWQFKALEHVELALGLARILGLIFCLRCVGGDEVLGLKGLEFHRIRSGFFGGQDELFGEIEAAVVVHAGFGDDEAGAFGGDQGLGVGHFEADARAWNARTQAAATWPPWVTTPSTRHRPPGCGR